MQNCRYNKKNRATDKDRLTHIGRHLIGLRSLTSTAKSYYSDIKPSPRHSNTPADLLKPLNYTPVCWAPATDSIPVDGMEVSQLLSNSFIHFWRLRTQLAVSRQHLLEGKKLATGIYYY